MASREQFARTASALHENRSHWRRLRGPHYRLGSCPNGRQVVCVERNPERLASLRRDEVFFHEPGISELFAVARRTNRFAATDDLTAALVNVERHHDCSRHTIDRCRYRFDRCSPRRCRGRCSSSRIGRYVVVAVKSTVVPGSTDGAVREEIERASSMRLGEFGLAMTPEFLREGSAVADFLHPDRIVIGASDERAAEVMTRLFEGFACPVVRTNLRNAEMIKYASNALLACLVSFSNEISRICERVQGLDEETVMRGLHLDRRFWVSGAGGRRVRHR